MGISTLHILQMRTQSPISFKVFLKPTGKALDNQNSTILSLKWHLKTGIRTALLFFMFPNLFQNRPLQLAYLSESLSRWEENWPPPWTPKEVDFYCFCKWNWRTERGYYLGPIVIIAPWNKEQKGEVRKAKWISRVSERFPTEEKKELGFLLSTSRKD